MARSIHRSTVTARLLSSLVLLVVLVSFTGIGYAVPASTDPGASAETTATPQMDPPEAEEPPAEEPAAEEPAAEEPPAEEQPSEEPAAEEPPVVEGASEGLTAGNLAVAPSVDNKSASISLATVPPTDLGVYPTLVEGNPSCTSYEEFKLDGAPVNGTYTTDTEGNSLPAGASITISNANPYFFDFSSSGLVIHKVIVKAGAYAHIYDYDPTGVAADGNLWSVPKTSGEEGYYGISHISFCWTAAPNESHIIAKKFHDEDADGVRDGGEAWLSGFKFVLESGSSETGPWTYEDTVTSVDPNGHADFGMYPTGWYRLSEQLTQDQIDDGWTATTGDPLGVFVFNHTAQVNSEKLFGNVVVTYEKTFELTIEGNVPDGVTFKVTFDANGEPKELLLDEGSNPFSGTMSLPHGTVIDDVTWWAYVDDAWVEIGSTDGETLLEDMTNYYTLPEAAVDIEKDGPTQAAEGDRITYEIEVSNPSDAPVFGVVVSDPMLGGTIDTIDVLLPGDDEYYYVEYIVPEDSDNPLCNLATASGEDILGNDVSDEDDHCIEIVYPAIDLLKEVSPLMLLSGETAYYKYTITNVGDVPLTDIVLMDDQLGDITLPKTTLGVDEWMYAYADSPISVDTTNVATVTGYHGTVSYSDIDSAFVDVKEPGIQITKTVDPTVAVEGDPVTYKYEVENTGDTPLWFISVDDDVLGHIGDIIFLDEGDKETLYAYTTAPADDVYNVATAAGYYGYLETEFYAPISDDDDALLEIVEPAIQLVKTGSMTFVVEPGDTVTYEYEVTNIGDVPLENVQVVDDKLGLIGTAASLGVDDTLLFTADAFISEDTTNVAVATGFYGEHQVSDEDDWFVLWEPFLTLQDPDIALDKSADKSVADPGDIVTYTLAWENVGDGYVDPLEDLVITDDFDARYMTVVDDGGAAEVDAENGTLKWVISGVRIDPGDNGTITYKLKIDDEMPLGTTHLDNVAVARTDGDTNTDNDSDTWRVTVKVDEPFLPFTGADVLRVLAVLALALVAGVTLRRFARVTVP